MMKTSCFVCLLRKSVGEMTEYIFLNTSLILVNDFGFSDDKSIFVITATLTIASGFLINLGDSFHLAASNSPADDDRKTALARDLFFLCLMNAVGRLVSSVVTISRS